MKEEIDQLEQLYQIDQNVNKLYHLSYFLSKVFQMSFSFIFKLLKKEHIDQKVHIPPNNFIARLKKIYQYDQTDLIDMKVSK